MNLNMEFALENNLDIKDITIISLLDLVSDSGNLGDTFEYSYSQIIKDLPILFDGKSYANNSVRLRRILEKEGMKKFVTRVMEKKGREKGTIITFKLNKENIKKLNVKGIVSQ